MENNSIILNSLRVNRHSKGPQQISKGFFDTIPTGEENIPVCDVSHVTSDGGVFICEHCHNLVFIDNVGDNLGNTVKCECGHLYLIKTRDYFEKVETVISYGDSYCCDPHWWDYADGFYKITVPSLVETEIPFRRIVSATCAPIVLQSGAHYRGEHLDDIDVGFTLSLMSKQQRNIVLYAYHNELNAETIVSAMKDYYKEETRKAEAERAAAEEAARLEKEEAKAKAKAEKLRRFWAPWNKFWSAISKFCGMLQFGQPD